MIKAIIFDFDGVLVESVDIKTKAFARLFQSEGNDIVKKVVDYHLQHGGTSRFEKFKYIYNFILRRELTNEMFEDLCHKFSKLVVEEVIKAPYVEGAQEFLDRYSVIYKCFVSSATPQAEIENIIKRRQLQYYFAGIYGAPRKKADIVKEIISNKNLLPNEVIYIGDALSDYKAATSHGINFIARINNNEFLFDGINCIKIKDLVNLKNILNTIEQGNPEDY